MGARWLLGGKRRVGKITSSVVLFFEAEVKLVGTQCRMRGRWLPCEAYDFDLIEEGVGIQEFGSFPYVCFIRARTGRTDLIQLYLVGSVIRCYIRCHRAAGAYPVFSIV